MTRRLLVDDLVDPLGWLRSIENTNPENGVCIDAKLSEVLFEEGYLSINLSDRDQILTATLFEKQLKTLTLSQVAEILLAYRGNYLLSALSHKIPDDR